MAEAPCRYLGWADTASRPSGCGRPGRFRVLDGERLAVCDRHHELAVSVSDATGLERHFMRGDEGLARLVIEPAVVEVPRLHFVGGPLADRYRPLDRGVDVMAVPAELTIEGFGGGRYVKSMVSWAVSSPATRRRSSTAGLQIADPARWRYRVTSARGELLLRRPALQSATRCSCTRSNPCDRAVVGRRIPSGTAFASNVSGRARSTGFDRVVRAGGASGHVRREVFRLLPKRGLVRPTGGRPCAAKVSATAALIGWPVRPSMNSH